MARDRKSPGKIDRLLDKLMEDGVDAEDLFGEDGLLKHMKKRMAERILEAELTDHLGYEKHAPDGMSASDIQGHVEDLYGVAISPELVSRITDTVTEEVTVWQSRPLDGIYPILFLGALFVKIRDSSSIRNKAIYQAATLEQAEVASDRFAERWDEQYPTISRQKRKNWDHVSPFFAFPPDDAARKLHYLVLLDLSLRCTRPIANWCQLDGRHQPVHHHVRGQSALTMKQSVTQNP